MFVAGIMMVIAGIAEVINAFRSETCGKFFALPPLDAFTSSPVFFRPRASAQDKAPRLKNLEGTLDGQILVTTGARLKRASALRV
jgi:hypothetical protein